MFERVRGDILVVLKNAQFAMTGSTAYFWRLVGRQFIGQKLCAEQFDLS
jgi:hypothetical protein